MAKTWLRVAAVTGAYGAVALTAATATAENPRFYNLEGFGQFLDGNPESTAITEEGLISLPPTARERLADTATNFSAATVRGDDVIVAKVDDGEVIAVDRAGKTKSLFKAEGTVVTTLAATPLGLFAATGSPAKIYRIGDDGKAAVFHTPDAGYVWAMVEGPGDSLLAATGEPGTVLKIDRHGNGEILFKPDQEHLKSITYDKRLGIFVGGGERGVLYRSETGKVFRALYDTGHPEVAAIVTRGDYVYAAGVTGAEALATASTEEKGSRKGKDGPEVNSQLAQVAMDGSSEIVAGSSDEAIFSMAIDDRERIVVATGATGRDDPRGRLYTVEPKRREIAMIYQSPSRRITHLVNLPRGALAAVAADGGRIVHLAGGVAPHGEFVTQPFDTGVNSRFGLLQIFGAWPLSTGVTAAVRTGQTAKPDSSWSDWSKEIKAPGARPEVQNGRYMQIRISLNASAGVSPEVHRVRLAYLRQNLPPFVREVVALKKGLALIAIPVDEPKSKTISLGEKANEEMRRGDDDKGAGRTGRARQVERRGALTVKWTAEDPNGDELSYDLSFKNGGGTWQVMKEKLDDPFYTINAAQLPDGHYQFKVRATDAPSNPVGAELQDTRESHDILVDNTPPKLDLFQVTVNGKVATMRLGVQDAVGPLIAAHSSLDGQEFKPVVPEDGVLDGPAETFALRFAELAVGSHTVTVRVLDEAENEGIGQTVFTVR
ncbi:MAG: hypothetical protein HY903_22465 [Deltaproteobacteria bacterium]|nr:hypothetical protein [Deltaproteobacteria bacterium]